MDTVMLKSVFLISHFESEESDPCSLRIISPCTPTDKSYATSSLRFRLWVMDSVSSASGFIADSVLTGGRSRHHMSAPGFLADEIPAIR